MVYSPKQTNGIIRTCPYEYPSILSSVHSLESLKNMSRRCLFVCLFVLDPYPHLSRGVNSRGRTYGEAPLPPRPLVTPGPRCSSCSLSPHTYCHASCIRSVPSPVLLSYTDILPSIWSAPSLSSCPTHINNPHTYEPLKPTYKLCYLLIPTALS